MHSHFRTLLGESPLLRIYDFFIDNQEFDYCMSEVARWQGMSPNTILPLWDKLAADGALLPTRKIGKGRLYRINPEHPLWVKLLAVDQLLAQLATLENARTDGSTVRDSTGHRTGRREA